MNIRKKTHYYKILNIIIVLLLSLIFSNVNFENSRGMNCLDEIYGIKIVHAQEVDASRERIAVDYSHVSCAVGAYDFLDVASDKNEGLKEVNDKLKIEGAGIFRLCLAIDVLTIVVGTIIAGLMLASRNSNKIVEGKEMLKDIIIGCIVIFALSSILGLAAKIGAAI